MTNLILASGSKNRLTALKLSKIPFTAVPADIDEKAIRHENPKEQVLAIAKAKVDRVIQSGQAKREIDIFSDDEPDDTESVLVLGADGVNIVGGKVLEKPKDENEAFAMIQAQSGKRSSFLTGYYAINPTTGKTYSGTSETFYTFRKLSEHEIHAYVSTEPVLLWAAAFSPANSAAITFVSLIEGSFSNFAYSMPFDQIIPILQKEDIL